MKHILDLTRFPIDQPNSPEWQNLVDRCRADIAADGMFNLEGLMRVDVAADVADGLMPRFEAESFEHARMHNIYFKKSIPDVAEDHPALKQFETSNRTLCGDQLGQGALMALYEWPPFAQFLAACIGKETLHTMADPLARVNVMAYREGQALNWHFDRSEFTTTLLLQAPEQGGGFEYCTDLRSEDDPNYDGVARLVAGPRSHARNYPFGRHVERVCRQKYRPPCNASAGRQGSCDRGIFLLRNARCDV